MSELVISRSTYYYPNFIVALEDSFIQDALNFLLTEDSLGHQSRELVDLINILSFSWEFAVETLSHYNVFVGFNLLELALTVARFSVGGLVLVDDIDLKNLVVFLALVAVRSFHHFIIILALAVGNGYDVITSCLINCME